MTKILFVCHGNICRSPMAEFVFREMAGKRGMGALFHAASAATSGEELGNPVHQGTREKLRAVGISCADKRAVRLRPDDYRAWDLLLGMDSYNLSNMRRIFGGDPERRMYRLLDYSAHPRCIMPTPGIPEILTQHMPMCARDAGRCWSICCAAGCGRNSSARKNRKQKTGRRLNGTPFGRRPAFCTFRASGTGFAQQHAAHDSNILRRGTGLQQIRFRGTVVLREIGQRRFKLLRRRGEYRIRRGDAESFFQPGLLLFEDLLHVGFAYTVIGNDNLAGHARKQQKQHGRHAVRSFPAVQLNSTVPPLCCAKMRIIRANASPRPDSSFTYTSPMRSGIPPVKPWLAASSSMGME